jgi:phage protein U
MYYLLFLLASTLCALPFGQCIVCLLTKSKSRQYTGQKEELTIHCPKGRADNTLAKRKSRKYTGQKEEQTIHWPKGRANNALDKRKSRQSTGQKEEQTIHWPKGRADNTLTKRNSIPYTDQKVFLLASVLSALPFGQCIVCSSFWLVYCLLSLTKRKSRQYTDQKEEQTIHWPKGRAETFWSVYCLLFILVSVLSALPFGQYIVCSSFWSVYGMLFLLVSVLSALPEQTINWPKGRAYNTLTKRKSRQYTGQKEEHTKYWPKERADNTRPVYYLLFL